MSEEQDNNSEDQATRLMKLLGGKWVVSALATAASLRLAHHLERPARALDLAQRLDCHAPSLERLLAVLAAEQLLERESTGEYRLTELGEQLRDENLGLLARFVGSRSQWTPWSELEYSVRSGRAAFEKVHGAPLFEYLAQHPEEAKLYDSAVDAFTQQQAQALAATELLHDARTVVDVGGGRGSFLLELLVSVDHLRGILFDLPHVVESARARFDLAGLTGRAEMWAGDFFERVPPGADCYVIKHVLHNWPDEQAIRLLRTCADAMSPTGQLFIVEGLLLPGNRRDGTRLMDLEMLVLTDGGRERSKPQFRRLLADSGLRLRHTRRLSQAAWLMVATPA